MSSLEMNKIAAAILTAGVVATGSGFIAHLLVHREVPETPVYAVAPSEGGATETVAEEAPALDPIAPLLASADAANGETVFRKCSACHGLEEGGANKVGPNLWNVVGANIGVHDGYAYSDALAAMNDQVWDYEALNGFLAAPKTRAPGTKMGFAGVRSAGDRADLIVYMREFNSNPPPLPE